MAILMPLVENLYIAPHLKALISGQKLWIGQRCGSTLSLGNALFKISILLHKMANECKHLHAIVCCIVIKIHAYWFFANWGQLFTKNSLTVVKFGLRNNFN